MQVGLLLQAQDVDALQELHDLLSPRTPPVRAPLTVEAAAMAGGDLAIV